MKTLLLSVLVSMGAAVVLYADPVIKFDDLPSTFLPVPAGYHELNWSNIYYLNAVNYVLNPSGFQAGVISTNNMIYGGGGITSVITAGMFDFLSASATAPFNDNLQLEAKGFIKGTLVYDQTNTLSATSPTLIHFNFYGVDEVDLTSSGGTQHAGYPGSGESFAMDNLNVTTYIPYTPALPFANGGFETGDFTGWSRIGNTNTMYVTNAPAYVHSGTYGLQIGPVTTPGFLGQTAGPTQIGQSYSVSFSLENSGASQNSFIMYWGGFPVFGLTNQPPFAWTNLHFDLVASRFSEFLEFQFINNSSSFGFDDVSVAPSILVSNGGFETGDFSGWTHSGNTVNDIATGSALRAGSYGALFGAIGSPGVISQPVATQPAQPYLVSLWLDSPDGQTPNEFHASWGGKSLADQTNMGAFGWTNLHYTVINAATQNVLQFGLRDDPTGLNLDEITVLPIPILQNGGFEFGDFTGWTTNGNFTFSGVVTNAHTGYYSGSFAPKGSLGFLSQTVATIRGQAYLIGFMLNNPSAMTGSGQEFRVSWNGTILLDTTNLGLTGWVPFEFTVPASGTNSTLQFGFRDDTSFLGLDDVFISPIPTPAFQSVANAANNLVNLSWSAFPGYLYELQYNTNLSQPNWAILQNFSLPTNTPMTATDTNPPDSKRFYRVLMAPPP